MGTVVLGRSIAEIIAAATEASLPGGSMPPANPPPCVAPDLMSAQDVQREYGIRDLRTARAVIREAGGKRIGGRWLVRRERLEAWEAKPDQAEMLAARSQPINHRRDNHRSPSSVRHALPPLEPGWLDDPTQESRR